MLRGKVWESECKQQLQDKYHFRGQDAAVAGLFGGDWLPLVSAAAGPQGLVFGFEPTDAINVSRTVVDANRLTNVRIGPRACLSNTSAVVRMCVRDINGWARGDRSHIVRASEEKRDGSTACGVEHVQCTTLDEALPWQSRRVGFLLLDVEGHEESALFGAAKLIRKWRPVIASELELARLPVLQNLLNPLGYRLDGSCPGLRFYRAASAMESTSRSDL